MRSIYLRGGLIAAVDHIGRVSVGTPRARATALTPPRLNHAEVMSEYQFVGPGRMAGRQFSPAIVVFGRHYVTGKAQ